jgi:hypothetical protein
MHKEATIKARQKVRSSIETMLEDKLNPASSIEADLLEEVVCCCLVASYLLQRMTGIEPLETVKN